MPDHNDHSPSREGAVSRAVVILGAVAILSVLYLASVGPVAWMVRSGGWHKIVPTPVWVIALEGFYYPLVWLCDSGFVPHGWLEAYVEWWCRGL